MGLVSEHEVVCERLPLVDVATAVPEVTLHVRVGQPNQAGPPPFDVRATGDALDALEAALDDSDFVATWARMGPDRRGRWYQLLPTRGMEEQLGPAVDDLETLRDLAANASLVESAVVTDEGWRMRRRYADREAFERYSAFWREEAGFRLHRLAAADPDADPTAGMTDRQREVLLTAHDLGYFEVPRRASLAEVADELGISPPACTEVLRRATAALVEDSLAGPHAGEPVRAVR